MTKETFPTDGEEGFWHDHAKELAVGSAIGLLGLVYVVASRRMHKVSGEMTEPEHDAAPPESNPEAGSTE